MRKMKLCAVNLTFGVCPKMKLTSEYDRVEVRLENEIDKWFFLWRGASERMRKKNETPREC